jgi:hypothetical protein
VHGARGNNPDQLAVATQRETDVKQPPCRNFGSIFKSFMDCAWRAKKLATVLKDSPKLTKQKRIKAAA